ncbi:lipopolysaccharide biosynthesis protein [Shewanella sp.]|uniref:lipopolysaccharide biosynthesis protein n=1 Tax=Shewanella sp. TaxID=50422 RepID=UPI0040481513
MQEISIGKKLVKSVVHSMTGRYIVYFVNLLSMMILARVFSPEIFGVFAVIQVFALFFALLSEMGFGPAIVNEKIVSNTMRDGIYSFTLILGLFISCLFIIFSPLISLVYDNDLYTTLAIPVALSILFNTAVIVPLSSFLRDRKFIPIARYESYSEIISVISVLIMVQYVDPITALALKPLAVSFFRFLFIFFNSKNNEMGMPKIGKEISQVKKILSFSKHQAGFNFFNYFSRNLDTILVGKYLGTISLGVYDKAYQIMRYPLMLLTFAMSPAIQPVMKELQDDLIQFEILHNKFVRYISLIGLLCGSLVYASSEYIVLILLGEQWDEVIPILDVLSLSIPIQIVLSTSGGFFQAAGRTDLMFKSGVFSSVTNVTAICLGIYSNDLIILCWCLLFSFTINFFQCYYIMSKYILLSGFLKFLKNVFLCYLGLIALISHHIYYVV